MYENYSPYIQSEIDYRRERIRSSAGSRKTRHHRLLGLRRGTSAAVDAR